jgi:acyl-CoA synthetase (AMP-forming)/AMP-acid ligase II
MIEHAAAAPPDKTAIVVLDKGEPTRAGRRLTYAELAATIRAAANRLCKVSGTSRPVVSILTPLLAESFIASWAGAIAVDHIRHTTWRLCTLWQVASVFY